MKERGANGDTEILIRGSLWGGIYYSVLIGCMVASQHPGLGGEPRNSQLRVATGGGCTLFSVWKTEAWQSSGFVQWGRIPRQ